MLLGIFGCITLCAGQLIKAVVWLWVHDIVLNLHHFAFFRTHQSGCLVAVTIVVAGLAGFLLDIFLAVSALGVHSDEGLEAVTAMDVHGESDRAESVSGINVTTVLHVVLHAPSEFVGVGAIGVLPVVVPEVVEVMDVGSLAAKHFAKHALLRHVERVKLVPVVAAVLENHAVEACLLREFDELPALLEVHGTGHLNSRVLAVLQGTLGNGEVMVPVGGYIYEVDIGALAEFLVSFLAAIDGCRRQAGITEILLTSLSTSLNIIAKSNNLSAWNVRETLDGTRSTHA